MSERLSVWRGYEQIGELWLGGDQRTMGFAYRQPQLAISNSLPLSQQFLPEQTLAHHWFGNLLPEERSRQTLVNRLGVADDDFSLLAAIGGDCAGALQILGADEQPATPDGPIRAIADRDLANWAEGRESYALFASGDKALRLSLAGAQDKVPVMMVAGQPQLPLGSTPSSHLLKFAERPGIVFNELYMNRLAALVGVPVPDCRLGRAGKGVYLVVSRYDRTAGPDGSMMRRHQEDFCQALGLPRRLKYQEDGGPTLADCCALLRRISLEPAREIRQLLRWQLFNVLTGNCDGHAKNLSLLQDEQGGWHLAPAYDLVCTLALPFSRNLGFAIGPNYHCQQLRHSDWIAFATAARLGVRFVLRELEAMAEAILTLADSPELQLQLEAAGLHEWPRLEQVRKTVISQCRRYRHWLR